MTNGYLVTIEGIDGTGKTTLWESLQQSSILNENNDVTFTREPTGNKFGQILRNILAEDDSDDFSELFLFMADHATHLQETVLPALDRNELVICDRYIDSRCAYQGHTLTDAFDDSLQFIHDLHRPWSRIPDCTILLDIDAETAVERTTSGEKYEVKSRLAEIRENYARLVARDRDRFVIIDATQSPADVLDTVVGELTTRLATAV